MQSGCSTLLALGGLLTACSASAFYAEASTGSSKPNVVIIFADDISPRELPIYGSTVWSKPGGLDTSDPKYRARTPVLDNLATEGCYFETVWGATVCMPSRAMIMTGRYATRTKWWDNRDFGQVETVQGKRTWYLFESSPITMGQVAMMGGYGSVWAGKTQMQVWGEELQRFGFDEGVPTAGDESDIRQVTNSFRTIVVDHNGKPTVKNLDSGKLAPGYPLPRRSNAWKPHITVMNEKGKKVGVAWQTKNPKTGKAYGLNDYGPDVEQEYCLDFMERKHTEGKPFFVYHTTHLGHGAFDWFHPDSGNKFPGTPIIEWKNGRYGRTVPNITGSNGVYDTHGTVTGSGLHRHVSYCDYLMWRYVEKAKELGVYGNTVFIFAADNGSYKFGKGRVDQQRGVHVPLVINAPGMTKQGCQKILVSLTDILPTLADIMGVKIPGNYPIDGKSLWPYLTTNESKHHRWIYSYKKGRQLIRGAKVLRDGYGKWWDVANMPEDHMSFPEIKDWGAVSEQHREEREMLLKILPEMDRYETEYNAPQ